MKRIIESTEAEGLEALLGETVTIFAANYIYTGKLVGVNDADIVLEDASIVYETGGFDSDTWADAQKLPAPSWFIRTNAIESYGLLGKK